LPREDSFLTEKRRNRKTRHSPNFSFLPRRMVRDSRTKLRPATRLCFPSAFFSSFSTDRGRSLRCPKPRAPLVVYFCFLLSSAASSAPKSTLLKLFPPSPSSRFPRGARLSMNRGALRAVPLLAFSSFPPPFSFPADVKTLKINTDGITCRRSFFPLFVGGLSYSSFV